MIRNLALLIALLPSLWFLWQARGLPHLGHFQDDGIYAGTAAAIAEGKGPRVESLPGEPWQVKYPPFFPAYLSLARGSEHVMALLVWLPLPALLIVAWLWKRSAWLLVLLGWNAYTVLFAGSVLSELSGTLWLLLSIVLLERDRIAWSGAAAGIAYLVRTASIALVAGALVWLLWKRRWRDAGIFCIVFAPFFLSWSAFTATHADPSLAKVWTFYLSYTGFYARNVSLDLLPNLLWTNFQMLVAGFGGLLFFNGGADVLEINFARLLFFASVSGLIREIRMKGVGPYIFCAFFYSLLLLSWNYIPQERFAYPLLPLLLHGFVFELRHLAGILRASAQRQKAAAVMVGALLAAGLLWTVQRNLLAAWQFAPSIATRYHPLLAGRETAYAWVRANTPSHANFLASDDTILRRATGRHGVGFHVPTRFLYTNDRQAILAYHRDIVPRMRAENLQYLWIGPNDLELDLRPEDRAEIRRHWLSLPELETVYESPHYIVRRLR